jgi:hypothetical protein
MGYGERNVRMFKKEILVNCIPWYTCLSCTFKVQGWISHISEVSGFGEGYWLGEKNDHKPSW